MFSRCYAESTDDSADDPWSRQGLSRARGPTRAALRAAVAAEMKPKTMAGGYVAELVAKGEAEFAVHLVVELLPVKGIKIVGLFPADLQKFIVHQAAATTKARAAAAAKAFLDSLAAPEMRALAVKNGFMN
jgi:ABC-type molybdate transport system substrate-binding protein